MNPKPLTLIRQVWKSFQTHFLRSILRHMLGIPRISLHLFMFDDCNTQVIKVPDDELSLVVCDCVLAFEGITRTKPEKETAMASTVALALVLWSLSCGALVQAQDFDFFYFVQQWPGSYCDTKQGCCFPLSSQPKAVFGIHGLWPNYNNGKYPQNCGNEPFSPQTVKDVVVKMDDDWGSLACPSSDSTSFWSHEWSKHGTCSGMSQHEYFQSAIDLYGNYDITTALANAGIVADGSQYQVQDVRNAIATALDGHLPGVECNKDEQGNKQLYQVYICVATDGSTLIDCPILPGNECKGSLEFPVFDTSSATATSKDAQH